MPNGSAPVQRLGARCAPEADRECRLRGWPPPFCRWPRPLKPYETAPAPSARLAPVPAPPRGVTGYLAAALAELPDRRSRVTRRA
jgi:hypothetical protein